MGNCTSAEFLLLNNHPAVRAIVPRFSLYDVFTDVAFPGGIHLAWFTEAWGSFNRALDADEIAKLAVGRLGSDAILQCNGGDSMVTLSSSHCETQTELAHSPGKVLDCRVNEFSCDSGDRVGTHGADEGFW